MSLSIVDVFCCGGCCCRGDGGAVVVVVVELAAVVVVLWWCCGRNGGCFTYLATFLQLDDVPRHQLVGGHLKQGAGS